MRRWHGMARWYAGRRGGTTLWTLLAVLLALGLAAQPAASQAGAPGPASAGSPDAGAGALRELTLEEAVALALERNAQIRQAEADLEEARLVLEETRARHLMQPNPVTLLQAETGYELARRNLILTRSQVRLSVEQAFYGVLRAENLAEVAREGVALAERQLAVAQDRVAAGAAAPVDAIRAESQLSSARAQLLQVEGAVQLALLAFRQTLGVDLDTPIRPASQPVEVEPIPIDLEADLAFALENRVEVLQALAGIEAARTSVELTDNDYTPGLSHERARVGLRKAELALQQVRDGITLEIRQLYQTLLDAERQVEVLEQAVAAAEESLRITEAMYEAGVATDLELLSAQTAFIQAKTNLVNARFDHREAQVRYAHAVARALAEGGSER
ncbi:MAG: TolC family protein [Limnochorda sp.]|uniref:TolC family protein n=1 Tax=Limnochorda sp. TaxID=1940279 RepID=UPI0039C02C6F